MQDEALNVARSAPQGAHYHADGIYLRGRERGYLWYSKLSSHQLDQ